MQTTLNKIKQHNPCTEGWAKLLTFLNKTEADDEPLELTTILESNGLDDALWALRAVDGKDREIRLMACDFAESVVHLANDERCNKTIEVSRMYANGEATKQELDPAWDGARAAMDGARAAAWYAAWADAWYAAYSATRADAWYAAWAAEREKQVQIFLKYTQTFKP